jgi:hypothetical protein
LSHFRLRIAFTSNPIPNSPANPDPVMKATVHTLAPQCLQFLQEVERTSGQSAAGVFVRRRGLRPGPRSNRGILLLAGAGLMALAMLPTLLPGSVLSLKNMTWMHTLQAIVFAIGVFLAATGFVRYFRKPLPVEFGSFLFADGTTLWEVNRDQVETWPLSALTELEGRIVHSQSGRLISLTLTFGKTYWYRIFDRKNDAEKLLSFLSVQKNIRNADDPDLRLMPQVAPGRFAAVAQAVAEREGNEELNIRTDCPDPPKPELVKGVAPPRVHSHMLIRFAVTILLAVGVFLGGKTANAAIMESRTFAEVPTQLRGSWSEHDVYLSHFPQGGHVVEVRERKDDQRFHLAHTTAKSQDSPVALREYLKDQANSRHRDEAKTQIALFYDRAIADLRARSVNKELKLDPVMFEAVIAVIEAMKVAERPVVTVGFSGTIDVQPKDELVRTIEKLEYDELLKQKPELKSVAAKQKDSSAILSSGEAFEVTQRDRREGLILNHLQTALNSVVKKEVLAVERSAPGAKAVLEVGYHIKPSGTLYVYTSKSEFIGLPETKGLLRGYDVDWKITVNPPESGKNYVWDLKSEPLGSLKYRPERSDPDWAPYAIILYSAFHDMSGRLVSNFAITPPKAPNSFSFAAVAASEAETVTGTDPFRFGDPLKPKFPMLPRK